MIDIDSIRTPWLEEQEVYRDFAAWVVTRIRSAARETGLPCEVYGREKGLSNLIKKCMNKGKAYEEVGDKAGVRIIVSYPQLVQLAEELVRSNFEAGIPTISRRI